MTTGRGRTRIPVWLASLYHPDLADLAGSVEGYTLDGYLRVANWRHDFVSRSQTYMRGFFRIARPELGALGGTLRLTIDNVDQRVTYALRQITTPATLTVEMVYAHAPDAVRQSIRNVELKSADINHAEVSASFGPPATGGPFMGITVNPGDFPGAFG